MNIKKALIERHRIEHVGWLRAAVLGANDGIVSTASLIVGVAAANLAPSQIVLTGAAGLVAGAMSMAAGEYVSVSSQADSESADLEREKEELASDHEFELEELAQIYVKRGLELTLAREVARQLMEYDALGTHAREELGITEQFSARPIQAALSSAAAFSVGAALPLLSVLALSSFPLIPSVALVTLILLFTLGQVSARIGGAAPLKASMRITFWGALAMGLTALIGSFFGTNL